MLQPNELLSLVNEIFSNRARNNLAVAISWWIPGILAVASSSSAFLFPRNDMCDQRLCIVHRWRWRHFARISGSSPSFSWLRRVKKEFATFHWFLFALLFIERKMLEYRYRWWLIFASSCVCLIALLRSSPPSATIWWPEWINHDL